MQRLDKSAMEAILGSAGTSSSRHVSFGETWHHRAHYRRACTH